MVALLFCEGFAGGQLLGWERAISLRDSPCMCFLYSIHALFSLKKLPPPGIVGILLVKISIVSQE